MGPHCSGQSRWFPLFNYASHHIKLCVLGFFFFKNKLRKHPSGWCVVVSWRTRWTSFKHLDVFLSLGRPVRKLLITARNWAFCCPSTLRPSVGSCWWHSWSPTHMRSTSLSMTHTAQILHLISPRLSGHSATNGLSWADFGGVSERNKRPTEVLVSEHPHPAFLWVSAHQRLA